MRKYKKSLFIFRRDLRLEDNTGLITACKNSGKVIPCFILDERFLNKSSKKYSKFRIKFLHDCLIDLDEQLRENKSHLYVFRGSPIDIIKNLENQIGMDAIFVNTDYTGFSKKRDGEIKRLCEKLSIKLTSTEDLLLHEVDKIKKKNGTAYKVFTAFKNKAKEYPIRKPQSFKFQNFENKKIKYELSEKELKKLLVNHDIRDVARGGRKKALDLLENVSNLKNYENERNFPFMNGTSGLSAHNKFGTCSIREVHEKIVKEFGSSHELITEIYWRDFFTYIMHHFPESASQEFDKRFKKIPWNQDKSSFSKWCNGKTGFPIVDAGMRELNSKGHMHNRVRMIAASFLTKDLHIDWRWGEEYFASKLIDYDPSVNIGNWQWAASTGCDAQPWFRIFNPWSQQEKFDSDCKYIKKWVKELKNAEPREIHSTKAPSQRIPAYPLPIVNHREESERTKFIFKKLSACSERLQK